jgi:hypothetical protein
MTLIAVLSFLALEPRTPELQCLHRWADCWEGIGAIVDGIAHHGYQLSLCDDGAGLDAVEGCSTGGIAGRELIWKDRCQEVPRFIRNRRLIPEGDRAALSDGAAATTNQADMRGLPARAEPHDRGSSGAASV